MSETTGDTINHQSQSSFFRLPAELRRDILAYCTSVKDYHIISKIDGCLALAPCLGPRLYENHTGRERYASNRFDGPDPINKQRLASTWGPHWMCEEFVQIKGKPFSTLDKDYGHDMDWIWPLRAICKRMCSDLTEWAIAEANFHVTDLRILGSLLHSYDSQHPPPYYYNLSGLRFIRGVPIQKLCITLNQPLDSYRWLDLMHTGQPFSYELFFPRRNFVWYTPKEFRTPPPELKVWTESIHRLRDSFPKLQKLVIWLDHSGKEYWSQVNEREVLAPILEAIARYDNLNFLAILPKVHPSIEDTEKHFLEDTYPVIHRVLRQRIRGDGGERLDFPHYYGDQEYADMDMAALEEMEGNLWRTGSEVTVSRNGFPSFSHCRGRESVMRILGMQADNL